MDGNRVKTSPDEASKSSQQAAPKSEGTGAASGNGGKEANFLNIKVTSAQTELFFKLKETTNLEKLMSAYYSRTQAQPGTLRFLFDGHRINPTDKPETLGMQDGDTIDVHTEQIGGASL